MRSQLSASRPFSSLVYADHDNFKLSESTLNSVTAAAKLDPDVHILVAGENSGAVAEQAAKISGVKGVLHADNAAYGHHVAENSAELIATLQKEKGFSYIVGSATASGKNIIPRVGAILDVAPLSDVIEIKSNDTFVRPIYAGNALATYKSSDATKVMTVRSTCFEAAGTDGSAPVEVYTPSSCDAGLSSWVKDELVKSERPELAGAKVVVSGGRGLGSKENFDMLYTLADDMGAAVGASRAAVDAGYAANDMQVGQTGKVVAPDLYVAVGISGAIQHLAGMKDSKTIVAINKDPDAAIFQVADYGLVGDLFEEVPKLNTAIKA